MPAVGCGDARHTQRFGERDDRSVDETEVQVGKLTIEITDASVAVPGEISHEIVAVDDGIVEDETALGAEPVLEQVIDFRDDGRVKNQPALFSLDERTRSGVPPIAAIVIGVDHAGVEEDAHERGLAPRGRFAGPCASPVDGVSPKPVSARTAFTWSAVSE